MTHYLLSTFSGEDESPPDPPSPDEMKTMMAEMLSLEAAMVEAESFVFSGRLHDPDAATVVQSDGTNLTMTDGPFAESKEHIAGFYIIEAEDLDDALSWASRVAACIGRPIEVQPFSGVGRMADQFPDPTTS